MHDLILKNGLVFDSSKRLRGVRRDIAIKDGVIAAIEEQLDPGLGAEVRDLQGSMVSAGWIDIHVHAYGGLALRDMQMVGVLAGATTVVDAGDFGVATFSDFATLSEDSAADVYGYVHPHPVGIPYTGRARADYSDIDESALGGLIARQRSTICGLKMAAFGDLPLEYIAAGKRIARESQIPFYLHIGELNNSPAKGLKTVKALDLLTTGDIATHIYSNDYGRIVDDAGKVWPAVIEAHRRGVVFDVGFGVGNFSYEIAERALEQGVFPDTISSDQNSLCARARADLPATMSRLLILGMSVDDVVDKVTAAPARALGFQDRGTLSVGSRADITVFRVESRPMELADADGVSRTTSRAVVPQHVYKNGRHYPCDVERIYEGENFKMKVRSAKGLEMPELDREERLLVRQLFAEMDLVTEHEWGGTAIHLAIERALATTCVSRKKALEGLYKVILASDSIGFTPQVGPIFARMGREDVHRFHEALKPQLYVQ